MVNSVGRQNNLHEALHFTLLALNITNVFIHLGGAYILSVVYRNSTEQRVQQMLLMNLAVTESLTNFLEIVRIVPDIVVLDEHSQWELISDSILIVSFSGLYIILYANMFYITIDRLLDIVLNIRYMVYVREKRAKYLIVITWIGALTLSIGEVVYYQYSKFSWEDLFFIYFYPPIQFAYLTLAIVTYGLIFRSYKRSRHPPVSLPGSTRRRQSVVQVFRKSRFYITLLLIITFVLFMIVPDLIYIFMAILENNHSDILITAFLISYAISNLSDAFIYIYVQKQVRRAFLKKIPCLHKYTNVLATSNFLSFNLPRISIGERRSRVGTLNSSFRSDENNRIPQPVMNEVFVISNCRCATPSGSSVGIGSSLVKESGKTVTFADNS